METNAVHIYDEIRFSKATDYNCTFDLSSQKVLIDEIQDRVIDSIIPFLYKLDHSLETLNPRVNLKVTSDDGTYIGISKPKFINNLIAANKKEFLEKGFVIKINMHQALIIPRDVIFWGTHFCITGYMNEFGNYKIKYDILETDVFIPLSVHKMNYLVLEVLAALADYLQRNNPINSI